MKCLISGEGFPVVKYIYGHSISLRIRVYTAV